MRGTPRKRFTEEQKELDNIIRSLGFETVLEKQFGNYAVDIYLPEVNKGIEFDGPRHFSKKKDRERDEWLKENFDVDVFRVTDLRRLELKEELVEFICK